ncbi:hypothetical protein Rsub_12294 [Raphidocelis subcapitata]|uniref:Uncharacterized protein n=1 Tax=Raphidocelis subcapitata TaxID=307507 RepID=A0A2V0PQV9_9CHLO|nr:hypothetical protein Rsub_12294 [Raphidocelis subcapitata]|eukprot:GBF99615.1 hypothetical protein Rsub_12294 [Raphidocelis subcapitata]
MMKHGEDAVCVIVAAAAPAPRAGPSHSAVAGPSPSKTGALALPPGPHSPESARWNYAMCAAIGSIALVLCAVVAHLVIYR